MDKEYWWKFKGFNVKEGKVWSNFYKDCSLEQVAKINTTPVSFINGGRIIKNVDAICSAFDRNYGGDYKIHYAVKANYNPHVLDLIAMLSLGVDVVSPNEAALALDRGIPKEDIMFTGTSVSERDLEKLVKLGVKINIDSESQLNKLVAYKDVMNSLDISVRMNPDVGAGHNPDVITAGIKNDDGVPIKFGIEQNKILDVFTKAYEYGFNPDTLHIHIGSGWLGDNVGNFREALRNTLCAVRILGTYSFENLNLDVGGGPGIRYKESQQSFPFDKYAKIIEDEIKGSGLNIPLLILEPGRSIVGDAGIILTTVNTVEEKNGIMHAYTDASMGTLIRPKLYHTYDRKKKIAKPCWHEIINISNPNGELLKYAVDGNVCETGDTFTQGELRKIPEIKEGDILGILDAGAYGDAMSSPYCMRGRANVLMEHNGRLLQSSKSVEDLEQILHRFNTELRLEPIK